MAVLVNTDGTLRQSPSATQALDMFMEQRTVEWHTIRTTAIPDDATPWKSSLLEIEDNTKVCKKRRAWSRNLMAILDENGRARCEILGIARIC